MWMQSIPFVVAPICTNTWHCGAALWEWTSWITSSLKAVLFPLPKTWDLTLSASGNDATPRKVRRPSIKHDPAPQKESWGSYFWDSSDWSFYWCNLVCVNIKKDNMTPGRPRGRDILTVLLVLIRATDLTRHIQTTLKCFSVLSVALHYLFDNK